MCSYLKLKWLEILSKNSWAGQRNEKEMSQKGFAFCRILAESRKTGAWVKAEVIGILNKKVLKGTDVNDSGFNIRRKNV